MVSAEIRHGLRSLVRQPGYAAVAILSLAMAIGINAAIASALHSLLLRPPALRDLDRSVVVFDSSPGAANRGTSFPQFQTLRAQSSLFADAMAVAGARPMMLSDAERQDTVYAEPVTASFFTMAAIRIERGQPFARTVDDTSAPALEIVLSHRFWTGRFAADPAIVGRSVRLNGQSVLIRGVAADGFTGFSPEVSVDLWIPVTTWAAIAGESERVHSTEHWLTTIGLLQPGVSLQQAHAAVGARTPPDRAPDERTIVAPARERPAAETDVLILAATAAAFGLAVLAVACTTLVNLLVARAAQRDREMTVRMALGSGRWRIIRLWTIESAALCLPAGALGLVTATWLLAGAGRLTLPAVMGQAPGPAVPLPGLDLPTVAATAALSIGAAAVLGLMAGLQVLRHRPADTGAARSPDRRFAPGLNLRSAAIGLQMAVSTLLLILCGLFARSWWAAKRLDPGFEPRNVLLLPVSSVQSGARLRKPPDFDAQLADRVSRLPGVESATMMDPVPLWFAGNAAYFDAGGGHGPQRIGYSRVGARYFGTLRIPMLAGREFTASDRASRTRVAIVNDALARRFWPGGSALGRTLRERGETLEIVGVAANSSHRSLGDSAEMWVYVPLAQNPTENPTLSLAIRTPADSFQLRDAVEREVRRLVPEWPAIQIRTLDEGLALQRQLPRLGASVIGGIGAFGLLLALIGVYGVMAFVVRQRRHELGIRLALGAPAGAVRALVVRQGMTVCLTGAAAGAIAAWLMTGLLQGLLAGVGPKDPLTFSAVPLLLLCAAWVACYLPARLAGRLNPRDVLNDQ